MLQRAPNGIMRAKRTYARNLTAGTRLDTLLDCRRNLRIRLFTPSPAEPRTELLARGLFEEDQIEVIDLAA